jgi:hypothetical protein
MERPVTSSAIAYAQGRITEDQSKFDTAMSPTICNAINRLRGMHDTIDAMTTAVSEHLGRLHGPMLRAGELNKANGGPAPVIGELETLHKAIDHMELLVSRLQEELAPLARI